MTWSAPTVADLKQRFPEFATIADGQVDPVLAEAVAEVPDSWRDADRTAGVLYLAGHLLASFGVGGSSTGGGGVASTGAIKSRKVGDVSVEFFGQAPSNGTSIFDQYQTTAYGKRYLFFVRRNTAPIAWV